MPMLRRKSVGPARKSTGASFISGRAKATTIRTSRIVILMPTISVSERPTSEACSIFKKASDMISRAANELIQSGVGGIRSNSSVA